MKQKKRTQPRFRCQIRTYSVHERHTTSSLTQGGCQVEKWLAPAPATSVHVIEFGRTRWGGSRYVCVEIADGARALFFFRHDDGSWHVFPSASDRKKSGAGPNDMRAMLRKHRRSVDLWVHGGVPANSDIVSQGVRVLCRTGHRPGPDDNLPIGELLSRELAKKHPPKRRRSALKPLDEAPLVVAHPPPIDLESGLAHPLATKLLPIADSLNGHDAAIREIVPHVMAMSSVQRTCVRRVIHAELSAFTQLSIEVGDVEEQLDDKKESLLTRLNSGLCVFDLPRGYPSDMDEPVRFDYHTMVERLARRTDEIRELPLLATTQLARWCDVAHVVLGASIIKDRQPRVCRPHREALRRAACSSHLTVVIDASESECNEIRKLLVDDVRQLASWRPEIRVLPVTGVAEGTVLLDQNQIRAIVENLTWSGRSHD
jgi:hypothetical protein